MSPPSINDGSSTQTSQSRRRFLLGIGAATVAVAGCSSDENNNNNDQDDNNNDDQNNNNSDNPDEEPDTESFDPANSLPYGKWLTTTEDGLLFAYANIEALPTTNTSDASLDELPEDPLLAYPLVMNQTVIGLGQLQLSIAGLTRAIDPQKASDSTVNEITVINQTIVAEGTFATDKLDEVLIEPTEETWGIAYEQTDTLHGYSQYEPAEVPDSFSGEPPVIAVAEETVVVSAGADQLERIVAAGDGDQSRIYESNGTVEQLLEKAGTGDLVVGEIGSLPDDGLNREETFETDPQFKPQSGEDVVAALEFEESGDSTDSEFALAADELNENRQEDLETALGTAAVDGSVSVDVSDDHLTASGTYDTESLGLTGSDSSGDESLSQAAATELVSPESLAFQYEPPRDQQFGEFWVRVTEDTDAAALRMEAESGAYNEFQPQERPVSADDNVAVQVDPDGDSVTVFAINDEGAVGELTTLSVPTDELSETAAGQAVPADSLSFSYESPDTGNLGSLTVEVVADTEAKTLVAQPQAAPSLFTDRVGSLTSDEPIEAGTTLETSVEPDGDEVIVYATVDGATGEVARWRGPE